MEHQPPPQGYGSTSTEYTEEIHQEGHHEIHETHEIKFLQRCVLLRRFACLRQGESSRQAVNDPFVNRSPQPKRIRISACIPDAHDSHGLRGFVDVIEDNVPRTVQNPAITGAFGDAQSATGKFRQ